MSMNRFTEVLESRTLMSAAPSPLTEAVKLDHVQIRADLLKFRSDMLTGFVTFQNDVTAIKNDGVANAATVLPLIDKFFTHVRKMRKSLKGDLLEQSDKVNSDERAILKDMKNISHDKHRHDRKANKADHASLLAHRIALQEDMIAGLNARIATRQSFFSKLQVDMDAIIAAAQTDPNATPQLVSDLKTAKTDKTNSVNTLTADLQTIVTDRTKLVADLTAMQTAAG
jgi:flagellar biosynthesis chaperone FliJ